MSIGDPRTGLRVLFGGRTSSWATQRMHHAAEQHGIPPASAACQLDYPLLLKLDRSVQCRSAISLGFPLLFI